MKAKGLTLVEVMVTLALTAVLLFGVVSFVDSSNKEMAQISAASAIENDFTLVSGAIQKRMATSFKYRALVTDAGNHAPVRALIPLIGKCRNLSVCEGAMSLFFVSPIQNMQGSLSIESIQIVDNPSAKIDLIFEDTSDLSGLSVGKIIGILNVDDAPLYQVVVGQQNAGIGKKKVTVLPFRLPDGWISLSNNEGKGVWKGIGAGGLVIPFEAFVFGPKTRATSLTNRSNFTLGLQQCQVVAGVPLNCTNDSFDKDLIDVESLTSLKIAANFKRPMYGSNRSKACNSIQTFFDLTGVSSISSCVAKDTLQATMRFDEETSSPLPLLASDDENMGFFDSKTFSLFKFEILNSLRFQVQLSRPLPQKAEVEGNRPREVSFYVNFI